MNRQAIAQAYRDLHPREYDPDAILRCGRCGELMPARETQTRELWRPEEACIRKGPACRGKGKVR